MKTTLFVSTLAVALTATSFGQVEVQFLYGHNSDWSTSFDGTTLSFFQDSDCFGYIDWEFSVPEETTVTYQFQHLSCLGPPRVIGTSFTPIVNDWLDQGEPSEWSGTFTLQPDFYDFIEFQEFQGTLTFRAACEAGTDTDGDGVDDCDDGCPEDPFKSAPGDCGCGVKDLANVDSNGDGRINIIDLIIVLNSWGSEGDADADADGNNIVDVYDLLIVLENNGQEGPCITSGSDPQDQDLAIALERVEQNVLPNFTTYRLYAQMDEGFSVDAAYGTSDNPLNIQTDTYFYQNEIAGPTSGELFPPLFPIFPEMEWDSYVTIGLADSNNMSSIGIDFTDFESSGDSFFTDNGGWFAIPNSPQSVDIGGKVLLAQLTVPTDSLVSGTLNLQGSDDLGRPFNEILSFTSCILDTDGDGVDDCVDNCPDDPNKIDPGTCGCGNEDTDTDGDGTADCVDNCPNNPNKTDPGQCGCGEADTDSDDDGTADCNDAFPDDPGESVDSDGDGVGDNGDAFPADPSESVDSDGDGVGDNSDGCPNDPNKSEPGNCGCGVPETDVFGDLDCDGDYDIDDIRLGMTTFGIEEAEEDPCPADVDGDGSIGFSDVLIILNDWGACP